MMQSIVSRTPLLRDRFIPIGEKLVCWLMIAGLTFGSIGCGKSSDRVPVYPVQGKVLFKGAPTPGATVVFYPATQINHTNPILPQAIVDQEGIFHLQSYEPNDGAPAGEYKIAITWPGEVPEGRNNAEMYGAQDQLKGRYS